MTSAITRLDRFIARLLLVEPCPQAAPAEPTMPGAASSETAERAFGLSLMFSGVRCVFQYAILPFVLPAVGIAADTAVPLLVAISVVAIVSIVFSLRRFWQIDYAYKWPYLFVSIVAVILLAAFIFYDVRLLTLL